jgi:hypothetical protein
MKIPAALPLIVAFGSGGLAGAVFTWWVHLPSTTVMTYKITNTKDMQDPANSPPTDFFVHTIEFSVQSGPQLDSADIGLSFSGQPRISGTRAYVQDQLHEVSCVQPSTNGVRCKATKLNPGFDFNIAMRTTDNSPPALDASTSPQLHLVPIEQYLKETSTHSVGHDLLYWFVPGMIVSLVTYLLVKRLLSVKRTVS